MIEHLLPLVSSHLRLKRPQAAVMLDFLTHRRNTPRYHYGGNGRVFAAHVPEVQAFRERRYQDLRELNARGPSRGHAGANLNP